MVSRHEAAGSVLEEGGWSVDGGQVFSAYDASRDFSRKAFRAGCYAPFVSLYFNTVGDVVACCKNQTYVLGNVGESSLDEIWRGARIGRLREAMKRYDFGLGCGHCEWQIKGGDHAGVYTRIFEEFAVDSEVPEWPAMMEFTLSNVCNFECVMCYGELSSLIRSRRDGLPPLPRLYDERFFTDLRRYLPHLQRAKFFGGEPFLAAENYRIWDAMIELGLKIPCHVTTNGSIFDARVERILDHFPTSISVSVDGATRETFEAIRVNGRFDEVMRNVRRFLEHARAHGTAFTLTHCLMRQNWHEFPQFLLLAEELGCEVWINTVIDPADSSLFALPPPELNRIADRLEEAGRSIVDGLKLNRAVWDNQLRNLRDNANERQARELAIVKEETTQSRLEIEGPNADHVTAAWNLVFADRMEEALAEARRTRPANRLYWKSVILRAHILRRMKDFAGAEQELARSFELTGRRPEAYAERAWLRLEQGRIDEGIADARLGLERVKPEDGTEATLQDALGFLLVRKRDLEGARAAFDRLLELKPKDPDVRVHRGWAAKELGFLEFALAEVNAALALDPKHPEAAKLRQLLLGERTSVASA
jgi:MoaA/NifB/PqqE/SkfB family radical SAM enzyme/Flp pilus assembly protein TadD